MKKDLLDILACPVCKGSPLHLRADNEKGGEVIEGVLTCPKCGRAYPIEGSIPNMLPPEDL
jgi:uncharacterized protein YbaR (Trm112 family)